MAGREYDLGAAELEVLRVLWDEGSGTVREVLTRLHDHGRKVAYTNVLTFLTRLEQKGFVTSNKYALAYVYRAKVTRERVSKSHLYKLVNQLYDGAVGPLVLQLVRMEQLSADEISELQQLIDRLDSRGKRRGK